MTTAQFQELVWQKACELYRPMPWRDDPSPYYVLLSELMLQQTQVTRVIPKFETFVAHFPSLQLLSGTSLADVLRLWSGLGYNRRAKFLWQTALEVSLRFDGELPARYQELVSLPGIGPNTAGAILNYAFEIPTVFIETNIRTVYFHHFFPNDAEVDDKDIRVLVAQTMDHEHPREWFWALMDYGAYLKSTAGGQITKSRHYKKQGTLKGSLRETRGAIIKALATGPLTKENLTQIVMVDERFERAMTSLLREEMIEYVNRHWRLKGHAR